QYDTIYKQKFRRTKDGGGAPATANFQFIEVPYSNMTRFTNRNSAEPRTGAVPLRPLIFNL
ncbi:hypothetical protein GlitD10_1575, partial [Gloeomargarita lithophora Alchichica-D10]